MILTFLIDKIKKWYYISQCLWLFFDDCWKKTPHFRCSYLVIYFEFWLCSKLLLGTFGYYAVYEDISFRCHKGSFPCNVSLLIEVLIPALRPSQMAVIFLTTFQLVFLEWKWGESTDHRWIPLGNVNIMTSSWCISSACPFPVLQNDIENA